MKILVTVKRVPDYQSKIRIKADGSGIETDSIKWIVNPFDEIAVEEAVKLREAGTATELVVVTIGPADAQTQLRYALAMGADRGIHVTHDGAVDSDLASRVLVKLIEKEKPEIVILGKQAIDSDANQTAQLTAARLDWPQACFASKVVIEGQSALVTREVDGGLETVRVGLPAVISTDLRLNTPRYASLPNIMKAKKKPVDELALASLGVDSAVKVEVLKLVAPAKRQAGKRVDSVAALLAALQSEAKVLPRS